MKIFSTLVIFFTVQFSFAQSFYVSPSGNDSNPGTLAQPWQTFQNACNLATAGSTVYLKAGIYSPAVMHISGTPGSFITFTNFPGDTAIIDGGSVASTLLDLTAHGYIKIIGLEFRNAIGNYSIGILMENNCHDIEIRKNHIHHIQFATNPNAAANANKNAQPIIVYGDQTTTTIHDILIDSNLIYLCSTGYSEGCSIDGNVDGFTITNNIIHDVKNIGILAGGNYGVCSDTSLDHARNGYIAFNKVYNCKSAYASNAGIYIDGGKNNLVERNVCYHNRYGIEVGCEEHGTCSGNIVRDNLIYDNDEAGLAFGGYNFPTTGKVTNCFFYNNTFFNNDLTNQYMGEVTITRAENCVMRGNIFYASAQNVLMTTTIGNNLGNDFDYNNYFCDSTNLVYDVNGTQHTTFSNYKTATGWDAHSLSSNPDFVDTAFSTIDLSLLPTSPCIDAGDPNYVATNETDIIGNNRIVNSVIDIGCFERQFGNVISEEKENSIAVFPNPCSDKLFINSNSAIKNIVVVDLTGREMKSCVVGCQPTTATENEIDISNLAEGIYFLQIKTDEKTFVITFVKE